MSWCGAYVAGHSTYDLAHAYDIPRDTVSAHLRRQGVLRRVNVAVVLDDDDRRRVVELSTKVDRQ